MKTLRWHEQREKFNREGYVMLQGLVSTSLTQELKERITQALKACAQAIGSPYASYLKVVSRWADPSSVTQVIPNETIHLLREASESLLGKPTLLKKINVITKNAYARCAIPYHQDISYTPTDPYAFSLWLSLDNVQETSGPLEVIPCSHRAPLKSAVDFWSPVYDHQLSFKELPLKLPAKAGDVICFDSRLWHGSSKNMDLSSRYALVTRWSFEGYIPPSIPTIEPLFFGMWTCGSLTHNWLAEALFLLTGQKSTEFHELIQAWMHLLEDASFSFPFSFNKKASYQALRDLLILHQAHHNHRGGDSSGMIYRTLWVHLLDPLQSYFRLKT